MAEVKRVKRMLTEDAKKSKTRESLNKRPDMTELKQTHAGSFVIFPDAKNHIQMLANYVKLHRLKTLVVFPVIPKAQFQSSPFGLNQDCNPSVTLCPADGLEYVLNSLGTA